MKRNSFEYKNYVELDTINNSIRTDPKGFVAHCESEYYLKVIDAADFIARNVEENGIVLLAGPSSSGKTTSSNIISNRLDTLGVRTTTVSMDDYFTTVDPNDKDIDYEAPDRLDIELLKHDLQVLSAGGEVRLPHYDFTTSTQSISDTVLSRKKGEVIIFEGLHALSALFDDVGKAVRIYVSPRMRVTVENEIFMTAEQLRFMRRCARDSRFRGQDFAGTLRLWRNVIRGEKKYVLPSKENADIVIDTSMAYEPGLLAAAMGDTLSSLPEEELRKVALGGIAEKIKSFEKLDFSLISSSSLMREFIGSDGLSIE